jgi:hypothetical protein
MNLLLKRCTVYASKYGVILNENYKIRLVRNEIQLSPNVWLSFVGVVYRLGVLSPGGGLAGYVCMYMYKSQVRILQIVQPRKKGALTRVRAQRCTGSLQNEL